MTRQGRNSWNHKNVAKWLLGDQPTYEMVRGHVEDCSDRDVAAQRILATLQGYGPAWKRAKTPDGATYTYTNIRAALVGWEK